MPTEAEQLLADLGYSDAWYSPNPQTAPWQIDLPSPTNPNDLEEQQYTTLPYQTPGQVSPPVAPMITSELPTATPIGWWGDIKDWFKDDYWGGVQDSLTDPFGPIDDFFKTPGNIIGGITESMGGIMQMLPMLLLMGGKIDLKKILMIVMLGGLGGGLGSLGGLFGSSASANPFGATGGQLISSDTGGGINPMMLMLMMGNKKIDPMMMMMMGMDPMTSMVMGSLTSSTGRRSYRRRGYSNASRRSYSAGLQAGQSRALMARS